MTFIQTISFSTSRFDEMQKMMDEQTGQESQPGAGFRGLKILKDRDHDGVYLMIVEFDSYEEAMANSARPETDAFAKQMAEMSDGPPSFGNYDQVSEETP